MNNLSLLHPKVTLNFKKHRHQSRGDHKVGQRITIHFSSFFFVVSFLDKSLMCPLLESSYMSENCYFNTDYFLVFEQGRVMVPGRL